MTTSPQGRVAPVNATINKSVRVLMALDGTTQAQIAVLLGLVPNSVTNRMHERSPWLAQELVTLSNRFGVTVDQILDGPASFILRSETQNTPRPGPVTSAYQQYGYASIPAA